MCAAAVGYSRSMSEMSDIEREAEKHSTQVDEGVDKVAREGDKLAGGRDHGLIDKGADAAEKGLANAEGPGTQGDAGSSPNG